MLNPGRLSTKKRNSTAPVCIYSTPEFYGIQMQTEKTTSENQSGRRPNASITDEQWTLLQATEERQKQPLLKLTQSQETLPNVRGLTLVPHNRLDHCP